MFQKTLLLMGACASVILLLSNARADLGDEVRDHGLYLDPVNSSIHGDWVYEIIDHDGELNKVILHSRYMGFDLDSYIFEFSCEVNGEAKAVFAKGLLGYAEGNHWHGTEDTELTADTPETVQYSIDDGHPYTSVWYGDEKRVETKDRLVINRLRDMMSDGETLNMEIAGKDHSKSGVPLNGISEVLTTLFDQCEFNRLNSAAH